MADPITGMISDVTGVVNDTVTGVADVVTDTVTGTAGVVSDTVTGTAGVVTDSVNGVTGSVYGASAQYTDAAPPAPEYFPVSPTSPPEPMLAPTRRDATPAEYSPMLQSEPVLPRTRVDSAPAEYDPASVPSEVRPDLSQTTAGEPSGTSSGADAASGVYENYDGQVAAIEQESVAEGEQLATGAGSAGGGDPLTMLMSAGVGWLLGHVAFIREPLDALAGDPAAIQAQVDQLMQNATELMTIANEHGEQVALANDWTGAAAESFHGSMDRLGGELASMASVMEGTSTVTAVSGEMVVAVRDAVETLITDLVTSLVIGALTAMAWSVITFGASVVAYIAVAIAEAVIVTTQNIAKITELMAALQRQGDRAAVLGDLMDEIATSVGRFSKAAGA